MRRAFVGLSTPLGFDYRNPATRTQADRSSSPNPILESPYGLLLLFDEIVFLTRSLCPENMRHLPYVRFLDEEQALQFSHDALNSSYEAANALATNGGELRYEWPADYGDLMRQMGVHWGPGVDNHSHGLNIGQASVAANATLQNLYLDTAFAQNCGIPSLELITNRRLQSTLDAHDEATGEARLTQALVLKNIPNYLTQAGPYHPAIEEVRAIPTLGQFRTWMTNRPKMRTAAEIEEAERDVEATLLDAQERVFLKHLDPNSFFKSVGKAFVGDMVGLAFPLTGTVTAAFEGALKIRSDADMMWQGFVIEARRAFRPD
jgi:hypothetical protein